MGRGSGSLRYPCGLDCQGKVEECVRSKELKDVMRSCYQLEQKVKEKKEKKKEKRKRKKEKVKKWDN
jgi:hypothetical protein